MASSEKLEDLNITQEELEKLTEALKQDEFKKLFFEYVEEISNPENRQRYESEIRQLENDRGMDVKFVNPEPGYVIKTTIGGEVKAFINVCKNEHVGKPSSVKQIGKDGRPGLSWTLPHSFTPQREDFDREKKKCQVFDFVVHPDTYRMAETNTRFKKMINDLALEGIRKQFDVEPDTKNIKFPKMKYKGTPTPTVIRTRLPDGPPALNNDQSDVLSKFPYPYDNQTSAEKAKQREEEYARKHSAKKKVSTKKSETKVLEENKKDSKEDSDFAVPKYAITHRSEVDYQDYANDPDIRRKSTHPKELVIEVFLPLLSSAVPIQLDIFERQLKLESTKPAKYRLELMLPFAVDENRGTARFDKARRKLVITLPVLPAATKTESLLLGNDLSGGAGDHSVGGQEDDNDTDKDFVLNLPNQTGDRPLIEEISSADHNDEQVNRAEMPTSTDREGVSLDNGDVMLEIEQVEAIGSMFSITHILPDFECTQTYQTVHFEFHIFKVCREKISLIPLSPSAFQLKMVSVGEGGFPVHYSCYVSFDDNCSIVTNDSQLEVLKDKVVLSFIKDNQSVGWWNKYSYGTDPTLLEVSYGINNLYNKRHYVCLFVCHNLCSVWPAKRLGRSTPNFTHALMSTRECLLARSMSRSFTYACGTDRSTKHPESDTR